MPKLVVDSGVAINWFVTHPYTAEARRVLDGYRRGEMSFLAPDLIYAEGGNIAWKKYHFQGLLAADAQQSITAFQASSLLSRQMHDYWMMPTASPVPINAQCTTHYIWR